MRHYIVVEGHSDELLLRSLLPEDVEDKVIIVVAGGKSSAMQLANSLSVAKRAPVALVIDADTENADRIREDELDFQDFASALPVETPPVLFLGVPDIATSVQDPDWVDELISFVEKDDYANSNPFQLRR
jgi:predicted ATP-dependent endonuclease of OLD family